MTPTTTAPPTPAAGERPQDVRRPGGRRWRIDGWGLLLLPTLALLAVFFAYPVGQILARTFTDHTTTQGGALANLSWFFGSSAQMEILLRTFATAALVTAICLLVGYPYAYLLTIVGPRWRMVLLGVVIVSCWQSIVVRNYAWRILLRDNGVLNDGLVALGLNRVELLGTTKAVVIGMSQVMAPFMILPLYAALRNVDRRLLLAARSLGASPATAFRKVYLPLTLPGVVGGALLVFVLSLGFFITPALLGSPQNSLLSQAIVLQINKTLDWGHAGAMSFVLLIATALLLAFAALALRRRLAAVTGSGATR